MEIPRKEERKEAYRVRKRKEGCQGRNKRRKDASDRGSPEYPMEGGGGVGGQKCV
jgi:hypothetical protein